MIDRLLLKVSNARCHVDAMVIVSKNTEEYAMRLDKVRPIQNEDR